MKFAKKAIVFMFIGLALSLRAWDESYTFDRDDFDLEKIENRLKAQRTLEEMVRDYEFCFQLKQKNYGSFDNCLLYRAGKRLVIQSFLKTFEEKKND